jgi:hypothetical protein
MVDSYPPVELFKYIPKIGKKYSLSERYHGRKYREFIQSSPVWRDFHRWLKSDEFIYGVLDALKQRHLDLGFKRPHSPAKRAWKRTKDLVRGRFSRAAAGLSARFEFSMLPANGGSVTPHTDAPGKIVTLIISMIDDGEWDPAFGGGTDLNRPKSESLIFNPMNRQGGSTKWRCWIRFRSPPIRRWCSSKPSTPGIRCVRCWATVRTPCARP